MAMKIKTKRFVEEKAAPRKIAFVTKMKVPLRKPQMSKAFNEEMRRRGTMPTKMLPQVKAAKKAAPIGKPTPSGIKKPQVKKPFIKPKPKPKPAPKTKKLVVIRKPMVQTKPKIVRDPDRIEMSPQRGRVEMCKCSHVFAIHNFRLDGHCSETGCECKGFVEG